MFWPTAKWSSLLALPETLTLAHVSPADFTANNFSKDLGGFFSAWVKQLFRGRMGRVRGEAQEGRDDSNKSAWEAERQKQTTKGGRTTDAGTQQEWIQTQEDIHTWSIVSLARSKRRRAGGIKQLTWTALWGMWVSLATVGIVKQMESFITIARDKQKCPALGPKKFKRMR